MVWGAKKRYWRNSLGLSTTSSTRRKKQPTTGKATSDVNPSIATSLEEHAGYKESNKVLEWRVVKNSFGFEQLDIMDYEYRCFTSYLSKYKLTRGDDKISVEALSKLFIDYEVLKSIAEGKGLCRRLNSTKCSVQDISIRDITEAGIYNKTYDGDIVRRLIRRINEREIESVLTPDDTTSPQVPPRRPTVTRGTPSGASRRRSSVTDTIRHFLSHIPSRNRLDATSSKNSEVKTTPPPPTIASDVTMELPEASVWGRTKVKILAFTKIAKRSQRTGTSYPRCPTPLPRRVRIASVAPTHRESVCSTDSDMEGRLHIEHHPAAHKVSSMNVIMPPQDEDLDVSDEEEEEEEEGEIPVGDENFADWVVEDV